MVQNNTRQLKVLELFSGTECLSDAFRARGHECFTVDWDEKFPSSLHIDIMQLTAEMILEKFGRPDIAWIGTDCSSYSVAAIGHHRRKNPVTGFLEPKTEKALFADNLNRHVLDLIRQLNPHFFFIENPVGGLRKMDFMQGIPRHTITYCLAAETRIITKRGTYEISSLNGMEVPLLTTGGEWINAPIRCYGIQNLYEITLSRAKKKKIIRATGNHKWFVDGNIIETKDLIKGSCLDYSVLPKQDKLEIIDEWVARGFTYGDGWILKNQPKKKSFAMFCCDKEEMLKYFKGYNSWIDNEIIKVYGMPREWKSDMPNIDSSPSVIYSWLAGYFAADGTVGKVNGQVSLSSAKKGDLEYIRDLCRVIGIDTYSVTEYLRKGYGKEKTPIYNMTFMKSFLTDKFFLRSKHKKRFVDSGEPKHQALRWSVVSVRNLNVREPVYCAEVPTTHAFALDDSIITHNCQYGFPYRKATDIWTNHPRTEFKPPCRNGDPCHEPAPRGTKKGLQALQGTELRSKYPPELCNHIVDICEKYIDLEPLPAKFGRTIIQKDLFDF